MEYIELFSKFNGLNLEKNDCLFVFELENGFYMGRAYRQVSCFNGSVEIYFDYHTSDTNGFPLTIDFRVLAISGYNVGKKTSKADGSLCFTAFTKEEDIEKNDTYSFIKNDSILSIEPVGMDNYLSSFKKIGIVNKETLSIIEGILEKDFSLLDCVCSICYLFKGSLILMKWALRLLRDGIVVSVLDFSSISKFLRSYSHGSKFLKKKTLTAYTTKASFNDLLIEVDKIIKILKVKKIVSKFNTDQRKLLSSHEFTDDEIEIMLVINTLDEYIVKNIIKKVSDVHNVNDVISLIKKSSVSYYNWDFDSFMSYYDNKDILELDCELIYSDKENGIILLKVNDFNTMSKIGNKTGWCISKYDDSWDTYSSESVGHQYILFDFNCTDRNMSMIGITMNKGNYFPIYAHLFNNDDCMDEVYFSYALEKPDSDTFTGILNSKNISLIDILKPNLKTKFDWSFEGFMNFVKENKVPKKFYTIGKHKNCVLIKYYQYKQLTTFDLFFEAPNIEEFLYTHHSRRNNKYIVFDFTKPVGSNESIIIFLSNINGFNDENIERVYTLDLKNNGYDILSLIKKEELESERFVSSNPFDLLTYNILYLNEKEVNRLLREYDFNDKIIGSYISNYPSSRVMVAFLESVLTFDFKTVKKIYSKYDGNAVCLSTYERFSSDRNINEKETLEDAILKEVYWLLRYAMNRTFNIDSVFFILDKLLPKCINIQTYDTCDRILKVLLSLEDDEILRRLANLTYKYKMFDIPVVPTAFMIDDGDSFMATFIESLLEDESFSTIVKLINLEKNKNVKLFRKKVSLLKFYKKMKTYPKYDTILSNHNDDINIFLFLFNKKE